VTTAQANIAVFRPAQHAAKLAVQDTVGTAYNFRHLLPFPLPSLCVYAAMVPEAMVPEAMGRTPCYYRIVPLNAARAVKLPH
jgi:hypothetical protein